MQCEKCEREYTTKSNYSHHIKKCKFSKALLNNVSKLYLYGFSVSDISKKLKINREDVYFSLNKENIKIRNSSEAGKSAHRINSERFKFSKKTKNKCRISRLKYLKSHPFDNSWRRSTPSYIEKLFRSFLNEDLINKYDIVREYCVFPYYLDFAFLNIKVDVETDGSQHWKKTEVIQRDIVRDKFLNMKGWKIYRIPEFKIRNPCEFEKTKKLFLDFLNNLEIQPKIFNFSKEVLEYETIKNERQKEKDKIKKLKKQERLEKRKKVNDERIKLISNIDLAKRGWVQRVSKIWNLSHTSVKRFLKLYFPELLKNAAKTKFIARNRYTKITRARSSVWLEHRT